MGFTQYPLFFVGPFGHTFPTHKKNSFAEPDSDGREEVGHPSFKRHLKKTSKKTCNAFTCLSILMESFVCEPLVLDLAGSPMDIRRICRMVLGSQDESNPQVKYSGIFCHQTYEGLSWSGGIFQILGSQTLETRLQLRERLQSIIKEAIFIFSFGITCWLPINYIFVLRYLPNYQDPLVHPSSRSQSQKLFGASESR